jgi:hypothetical protein
MVTIVISIIALSVSVLTAYFNSRQKKFETQRTLRNQLTEVLGKIATLNLELAKIPQEGQSASGLTAGMRGHLVDQKRLLVRQANYITDQIPELVNPFEYLIIAGGFVDIDDTYQAEEFFRKAIVQAGSEQVNLGIVTRNFARFLFSQGETERAREQYSVALGVFSGESDISKFYRGDTYLRWGSQELDWSYRENANQLFECARAEFDSQRNPISKRRNLQHLSSLINSTTPLERPTDVDIRMTSSKEDDQKNYSV